MFVEDSPSLRNVVLNITLGIAEGSKLVESYATAMLKRLALLIFFGYTHCLVNYIYIHSRAYKRYLLEKPFCSMYLNCIYNHLRVMYMCIRTIYRINISDVFQYTFILKDSYKCIWKFHGACRRF